MYEQIAAPLKTSLKMKSNIQTYDMRDSEEFKGVFETELLISVVDGRIELF